MFGGQRSVSLGYQQFAAVTTLQTPVVPSGCNAMVVTVETNQLRYRDDGVAPTGAVGNLIGPTTTETPFEYTGSVNNILFFPNGGTSTTFNVAYYKLVG
jgi:hypothetical protein